MKLEEYDLVPWIAELRSLDTESEDFEEKMDSLMNKAYEWCTDNSVSEGFNFPGYGHIFHVLEYSVWLWDKLKGETLEYRDISADEEHSIYDVIRLLVETIHW